MFYLFYNYDFIFTLRALAFGLIIKSRRVNRGSFLRAENYTKYTIMQELKKAGFEKIQVFSDLAGKPYD